MFAKPSVFKENAELIKRLQGGARFPPDHDPPKTIRDSGFANAVNEAVFEDFRWFGSMMNISSADLWMVEETPKTLVSNIQTTDPELGRTYKVFYNGVEMGDLQVTEGHGSFEIDDQKRLAARTARAYLHLHNARFLPYDDIHGFLALIEVQLGTWEGGYEPSWARARLAATQVLTGYLWEVMASEDAVPWLLHHVDGPYWMVRHETEHWKAKGFDPLVEWKGDRRHR
jgi:hypothetical protein